MTVLFPSIVWVNVAFLWGILIEASILDSDEAKVDDDPQVKRRLANAQTPGPRYGRLLVCSFSGARLGGAMQLRASGQGDEDDSQTFRRPPSAVAVTFVEQGGVMLESTMYIVICMCIYIYYIYYILYIYYVFID